MVLGSVSILLWALPLCISARDIYAYRSDGKMPDMKFYKLCYRGSPYPYVDLVYGDRCGHSYTDEGFWFEENQNIQVIRSDTHHPKYIETVLRHRSDRFDFCGAQKLEVKKMPGDDLALKVTSLAKSLRTYNGAFLAYGVPSKLATTARRARVILKRDIEEPLREGEEIDEDGNIIGREELEIHKLLFNGNAEFGTFGEKRVNPEVSARPNERNSDETILSDLSLDLMTMSNFKTAEKIGFMACQLPVGKDKSGTRLQLHVILAPTMTMKPTGKCFPVRLTVSKNLVHHAKDIWLQEGWMKHYKDLLLPGNTRVNKDGLPFPFELDLAPSYSKPGELLYDIKTNQVSRWGREYSVLRKGDTSEEELLRFNYISNEISAVIEDYPERYLPEKNRIPKRPASERDVK